MFCPLFNGKQQQWMNSVNQLTEHILNTSRQGISGQRFCLRHMSAIESIDCCFIHSRSESPRFVWSAVEIRGSGNTAFRMSFSSPELHGFFLNCVSCSSGNGKRLNFLIGCFKMNAQQGTTFYPSTHNVFLAVEFKMLARVYQPVEI